MKKHYFKVITLMVFVLSVLTTFGQTESQRDQISSRYDKQLIQQLFDQYSTTARVEKQRAVQLARNNNWPLIIEENGTYAELQRVTLDGKPIYYTTFNVNAAKSTRANHLNSGGSLGLNLDGQNMLAHVWDGGLARSTHQEYDGPGGNNRFSIGDGTSALHYHSAHVTGTIIASGVQANAKGMAPQAQAIGYDWNSDVAEATSAAGNGMLISNHSYGFRSDLVPDQYFGAYISDSRDWDNLLFNAPNYLMVVAAGNDGNSNYNGSPLDGNSAYDKLTGHATSKNNLVVANAQDANIDVNGNLVSVNINSGSSEGPTDDYRIKPDITGNGTSLYSTYESSDTAYNSITGTSMASPNVAGTLLILQQHANNVNGSFMKAATLKGLVLHTADDAGSNGPDAIFGWGLLNAKRAAEAISNNGNESKIEEVTLTGGQTYQITVESDGVNDLMASISWTDRAGTATSATNSNTPVLVNDLDLRVTKSGTTHTPWKLTGITTNGKGDNNVDPYERVDVSNGSGTYTLTVTHKGSLTGGSQNFSLIVTGLSGTPVVCNATTPTGLNVDGFGDTTATISWDPIPGASFDLRYRESGTSTWTTNSVSGSASTLNGLTPETSYEVQVRSKCPDNSTSAYSGSVNFTTTEVQLNYCSSESTNINDEYIGRVQLNTIDNTSGGQFYTDFTNISTNLTQDQNYTITVTPTWTGTIYNEGYSVWIDYNKDGDFNDAGEQVWTRSATSATPVSGNFTVPSGSTQGNTRMRVSMKYNGIPTSCETFTYGEVEDYTVNIQGSGPDTTAPIITLNGASTIDLNVGDSYTEQGATATDNVDGDISANILIGGDTVDTNNTGTYIVTYNVSDAANNAAAEVTRTINVTVIEDTIPPVITLNGSSTINLNVGDNYSEQGATATDNVDGDISANIIIGGDIVDTNNVGTYVVTYNVSDAANNSAAEVTRTINVSEVQDTIPPVITLNGSSTINLNVGDNYSEQGATATDNVDGDISANIIIGGDTVDTNTAGTYSVTYNVSDAAGNAADQITRTVIVTALPTCDDGIQNGDETGVDCGGSCAPCSSGPEIIHQGYFESGWDGWSDGGSDCARVTSSNSYEGSNSIRLRDNSGTSSSMTLSNLDIRTYDEVEIEFYFYPRSMENGEDFWVRYYNGSSWSTVASYSRGTSFQNGSFYVATVNLDAASYNFALNSGFRFQCDASGNNDQIYIDQVTITGITNGTLGENMIASIGGFSTTSELTESDIEDDFMIYPNPVNGNVLNVKMIDYVETTYRILNMRGQIVQSGKLENQQINVASLNSGMYFIEINDTEEIMTKKFVRQ